MQKRPFGGLSTPSTTVCLESTTFAWNAPSRANCGKGGGERESDGLERERRGGGLKMHNFIRPWYVKLRERLIVDRNEKSHDVLVRVFHAMMSFD